MGWISMFFEMGENIGRDTRRESGYKKKKTTYYPESSKKAFVTSEWTKKMLAEDGEKESDVLE